MELRKEIKELKEKLAELEERCGWSKLRLGAKIDIDESIYIVAIVSRRHYALVNVDTGNTWAGIFVCEDIKDLKDAILENIGEDEEFKIVE